MDKAFKNRLLDRRRKTPTHFTQSSALPKQYFGKKVSKETKEFRATQRTTAIFAASSQVAAT